VTRHELLTAFRQRHTRSVRVINDGFTLVELLVIVAIVAILASMLLAAIFRAKQAADNTVCRNNLRQQGIGLAMYVADEPAYPLYQTSLLTGPGGVRFRRFWPHLLEPYVGGKWPDSNSDARQISLRFGSGVLSCPGFNRVGGIYSTQTQGIAGAFAYNAGTGSGLLVNSSSGSQSVIDVHGLASTSLLPDPSYTPHLSAKATSLLQAA
jgi:prepilin-type N-terminal cleavage/methylation domain-containing protein